MADLILAALALVCLIINSNIYSRSSSTKPPKWLANLSYKIARVLRMRKKIRTYRTELDKTSATKNVNQNDDMKLDKDVLLTLLNQAENPAMSERESSVYQALSKLVAIGTLVVDKAYEDEDRGNIQDEWILIGNILDRLFFIIFSIIILVITIGYLGIYPLYSYIASRH